MNTTSSQKNDKKAKSLLSKLLKYGLPLAISVGLCYVLFHDMDFDKMIDFINRDCDFSLIFVAMAVGVFGFVFRALRWRIQLRAAGIDPPVMPLVYSIVGTYAVNIVLPRFGELWRCEYISRRQRKPFATVLGSMVAERLADTVTVLLLTLLTLALAGSAITSFFKSNPESYQGIASILSSPFTYVALVAAVILAWLLWRWMKRTPWGQKVIRQIRNLLSGFNAIFHMRGAAWWLLLTIMLWGSYLLQMYICFQAFGMTRAITAENGFVVVLVCFVLGSLSMAIPSNGGIGPYQIALVFGLKCFCPDIDETSAYSFANVVLGSQTLLIIVAGLISFLLIAIDNRRLSRIAPPRPEQETDKSTDKP